MNAEKLDLTSMPFRMQQLPKDERGFPVPWFVAWVDGKPEFRAMDGEKFVAAIKKKLCWVCGSRLGVNVCFVVGPMCGINRTSSEPPSHLECGRWSVKNCPFLSNPRMVRRDDEVMNRTRLQEESAGFAISRNPGVTLLWITRSFEVFPDGLGKGYLLHMGEPETVEFYREGRAATHDEIMESVDSGVPILATMARQEEGGLADLERARTRFLRLVPGAL